MARKAFIIRVLTKKPKYSTRRHRICLECGRPRAVFHQFGLCRVHLREKLKQGLIAGFRKRSW